MSRFWKLLKYELLLCHRSYHLIRHSAYVMLLSNLIFSLMISNLEHTEQLKIFLVLFGGIIATVTIPSYLVKAEMQDGSLENLFVKFRPTTILLTKYCSIVLSIAAGMILIFPIILIFYALPLYSIFYIGVIMALLLLQIVAITLLGNIIHAYFRHNTNIILSIIIPIIIPSLILASIAVNSMNPDFLLILVGVSMILIPITLVLANYLLSNLYEF